MGSARFSYTASLPSKHVFDKPSLQHVAKSTTDAVVKKNKKRVSLPVADFEDNSARANLETSIRYGSLQICSKNVTMEYDEADGTFTVTGAYGLSTIRAVQDAERDAEAEAEG